MISTEEILQGAARDGSFDVTEWPRVLDDILARLDEIVQNDFPKPSIPIPDPPPPPQILGSTPVKPQEPSLSSQESQSADKENAPPPSTPPRPPVPQFSQSSTQPAGTPTTSQESQALPAETINFYTSIRNTLSKNFARNPPHTIQRLSELVLSPRAHYRCLPPYLRALDRVVSVSSPTTIFPLPIAVLPSSGGLLNGTTPSAPSAPGSDESLGGALLTPIPWLRDRPSQSELVSESTEMVEGPNGAGRIETVSVINGMSTGGSSPASTATASSTTLVGNGTGSASGSSNSSSTASPSSSAQTTESESVGVTQGELLRQEQEAGVVPTNQGSPQARRNIHPVDSSNQGGNIMETVEGDEEPEVPHARGPEEIGMEDMGPQRQNAGRIDIEAAVGRPAVGHGEEETKKEEKNEEMPDAGETMTTI
ncbi:uncharacterized protein BDZ99DRAFT_219418 [Mytilinidion resinicola]|uniref:PPP4R2-domain-containing protein n=1 Tax=Mytilinidion resinicola TaxID=574789 RepID=A0A6A6XZ52_9PEZI|nr:uncharacterized protein BDZ99DRAFT_219418 [Mytilinidion resinicola]KAF2801568.1 hypothetical protein BDZ99DRAFT_219418 [Mytilinidion resinicola]